MKPPRLNSRSVRQLWKDLQAKRFAVPKLQRNFVWDASRAAKLLDSIYREMPIGSLFLWEIDRRSANLIRQAADVLPAFDASNKQILFVIDGQQRLSVIYQAFEGQRRTNDAGREIDFSRLCFVVRPDAADPSAQRIVYRKPHGREIVSLKDILSPGWKARMPNASRRFRKAIADCRARLLDYPVPLVTVASATLEEIGEVFIRVNSQGMRITSADRAIALMGELDVRAMAYELRQRGRETGLHLSSIDPVLMGFNLVAEKQSPDGDPPKLAAMARRWSRRLEQREAAREEFRRLWDRFQRAFSSAVDYLTSQFPVHDETFLPSANMLATLSVFFFHQRGRPNAFQAQQLRRWFWATGVAQRYTGRGYHRNIVGDAHFFRLLANGSRVRFTLRDQLDPVIDIQGAEYGSRSARARAFFCLLATLKPRYLETGDQIQLSRPAVSHVNARHRHHIYPQRLLRSRVSRRAANSLCNICFLVAHDNSEVGKRRPWKYLADYKTAGQAQFKRVMKSHLIPAEPDAGVWVPSVTKGFNQFRRERLTLICTAFETAAGMRLFRR